VKLKLFMPNIVLLMKDIGSLPSGIFQGFSKKGK
jgi:hypothetical protein